MHWHAAAGASCAVPYGRMCTVCCPVMCVWGRTMSCMRTRRPARLQEDASGSRGTSMPSGTSTLRAAAASAQEASASGLQRSPPSRTASSSARSTKTTTYGIHAARRARGAGRAAPGAAPGALPAIAGPAGVASRCGIASRYSAYSRVKSSKSARNSVVGSSAESHWELARGPSSHTATIRANFHACIAGQHQDRHRIVRTSMPRNTAAA